MSKVVVNKQKIDILANAISAKSGEPLTMTLDEMVEAVDGIEAPSGSIDIDTNGTHNVTAYNTAVVNVPSQDNTFVITLSWDDDYTQDYGAWIPDCTFAEVQTAYNAGKEIVIQSENPLDVIADGVYIETGEDDYLYYTVFWYDDDLGATLAQWVNLNVEELLTEEPFIISPNLESREVTYTPSNQAQENWLYPESPYNGFSAVGVTVNPVPNADWDGVGSAEFITQNNQRKWRYTPKVTVFDGGWISQGTHNLYTTNYDAIPSGTTITPTTSAQTIGGANYMMEDAVTVSAMPSGTAGTPTATKGTVSNHSVSITPSVTNTTGFIQGSTKTGTAVNVSASELVSGTLNVTSSGTKDVTNYASASIPSGTEGTPTATKGTVSNHSVSVTPSVTNTSGYISGGTHSGTAVTVSASELVSGSETKTANGTYDVTNLAELVVNVSGGGSSMNIQADLERKTRQANSYGNTGLTLTVAQTGTYTVSWTAWRSSSSGTMGTNLHVNSTSGTNQQTFTNTYGQQIVLTNQHYNAGDVLTLYATSGSTSRVLNVANLIIVQTA